MGLQRNLRTKQDTSVRTLVGRLCAQDSGEHQEKFFLIREGVVRVPLEDVIAAIEQAPGRTDSEITGVVNRQGFRPSDVATARLYLHRFGPDIKNPQPLPQDGLGFLLDENTSPQAVLPLSAVFGWSTHVECEGPAGRKTPDADIWGFAMASRFKGFVTRDSDFLTVPLYREFQQAAQEQKPAPFLVYVRGNPDGGKLVSLLIEHASGIQSMMTAGSLEYDGCAVDVAQNKLEALKL